MKQRTLMLGMVIGSGLALMAMVGLALLPTVAQASSLTQTATATPSPETTVPDTTWPGKGFRFGFHHGGSKTLITAAANVTGLTAQEVLTQLQGGQTLAQIAESNGKTADDVIEAARALLQEQLSQEVASGWITQAQADAALEQFDANAPDLMTSVNIGFGGHGRGFGGRGPGFGFGHHGGGTFISAAASVTGLTTNEVLTQLQSGQSLAQIAEANGKTAEDVIAAARTQLEDLLNQAVADGRLTQAQADAKLANFDAVATDIVNSTGLWQHGPHGQWPKDNPTTPTPVPSSTSQDA
jgi:uncharacterized protein (DUF433 family)